MGQPQASSRGASSIMPGGGHSGGGHHGGEAIPALTTSLAFITAAVDITSAVG